MAKIQPRGMKTNYKTRLNYMSGATECSDKCRCNMCRLEGKGIYKNERNGETGVSKDGGV